MLLGLGLLGREPLEPMSSSVDGKKMKTAFEREEQMGAFLEWMRLRKEAAHLQIVQRAS